MLRPHTLSISHYKPYPSWQAFLAIIVKALDAYRKIATPIGIDRIGLRYMNQFSFPASPAGVELEDYFDFRPFLGDRLPQTFYSFTVGVHFLFDDEKDVLRVQMGSSAGDHPGLHQIMLDLDYFPAELESISFDFAGDWIDHAHTRIRDTFEGSLKDALRAQFEEMDQ